MISAAALAWGRRERKRFERRARGDNHHWWYRGQIALAFCEPPKAPIDRTGWGEGLWDGEPDFERWQHAGLACVAMRQHGGAWCGYVNAPKGHPWRAVGFGDIDVHVHGGLTYSQQVGADHWLGFDCNHAWDLAPGRVALLKALGPMMRGLPPATYRDLTYVRANVEALAEQAASAWQVD
jgi:hypothetical protein